MGNSQATHLFTDIGRRKYAYQIVQRNIPLCKFPDNPKQTPLYFYANDIKEMCKTSPDKKLQFMIMTDDDHKHSCIYKEIYTLGNYRTNIMFTLEENYLDEVIKRAHHIYTVHQLTYGDNIERITVKPR